MIFKLNALRVVANIQGLHSTLYIRMPETKVLEHSDIISNSFPNITEIIIEFYSLPSASTTFQRWRKGYKITAQRSFSDLPKVITCVWESGI